jgi:hypothetical protein
MHTVSMNAPGIQGVRFDEVSLEDPKQRQQ